MYMLKPMCRSPRVQEAGADQPPQSPSATAGPQSAHSWTASPPPPPAGGRSRQEDEHAIADQHVGHHRVAGRARAVRTLVRRRAHSGQRMPDRRGVMQSGQIGRPQFEHETPVSRLGWR